MHKRLGPVVLLALISSIGCAGGSGDDGPSAPDGSGGGDDPDARMTACQGCNLPNQCCFVEELNGDFCLDTSSDSNNCGDCGHVCDPLKSDSCAGSQCKCGISPECPGDATCCETGCKDLTDDAQNCGECGRQCAQNESCMNSDCVCAAEGGACGAGESCCPSGCANTTNDYANCGACGNACDTAAGEDCVGSACTCGGAACAMTEDCCGGGCVDICFDTTGTNCGACGASCLDGDGNPVVCFFGSCPATFPPPPPLPQCM
jgi:hypothetical protein